MACSLDTYSPNQPSNHRISFSNDFAEAQQQTSRPTSHTQSSSPSLDFEFSVGSYDMMSAEELFFKGQLLPLKEQLQRPNTLREELLLGDHDVVFPFGPQKSLNKWKDIFGLKKTPIAPNKVDKADSNLEHNISHFN